SHHHPRHRGPEGQVPAHADQGPQGRRLLPDRIRRRFRRRQGPDRGQAGRRPLCPQRLQDLHHQRLRGRRVRGLRHDRQVQGHPRHLRLHRGEQLPRLLRGQARREDGPARLPHRRDRVHRLHRSQGEPAGPGGQGLQDRHADPG
ncbi:dUTP diphosphatase, partial [Dysosmobacter welbionis]